ncbi:MAG: hypothetical protein GEU86_19965 [Actinophytocola sp.]|nr:hypothetical protein [Actinophytocola sp.]
MGTLLRVVRSRHPGVRIEPHQRYPDALCDQLLDGEIDLGLCRGMRHVRGLARR